MADIIAEIAAIFRAVSSVAATGGGAVKGVIIYESQLASFYVRETCKRVWAKNSSYWRLLSS